MASRCNGTSSVRPPVSYTNALKRRQIVSYGYADRDPAHYEEDHLVPLGLGGDPRSERNLWPEPRYGTGDTAGRKDGAECRIYARAGKLSASAGQALFLGDGWLRYER
jgi:hypothetical protein